jgi:hypothetical protein
MEDLVPSDRITTRHKTTKAIKCTGCGEIGWLGDDPRCEYRASLKEGNDES